MSKMAGKSTGSALSAYIPTIPEMYVTAIIGVMWMLTTAFYSNYANTVFIKEMESVVAHNLSRFAGSALLCILVGLFTAYTKPAYKQYKIFLAPSMCIVLMNVANSIALKEVGVTLTYTVKSTIPVWTCLYSYLYLGERYSYGIIGALLTSCMGVALAAAGDVDFSLYGFGFAVVSCLSQTAFTLLTKKALKDAKLEKLPMVGFGTSMLNATFFASIVYQAEPFMGLASPNVYTKAANGVVGPTNALLADTIGFPFDMPEIGYAMDFIGLANTSVYNFWPLGLVLMAASSYFCEYGLNFVYVSRVSAVTASITDIVRRLSTILINSVMFGYTFTALNGSGIAIGLTGALLYALLLNKESAAKAAGKKMRSSSPGPAPASPAKEAKKSPAKPKGRDKSVSKRSSPSKGKSPLRKRK